MILSAHVPKHAIETASGFYVDVTDPDPAGLNVMDISHSLSRQSRFAGHTDSAEIWSIGQHSLFVEKLLAIALKWDEPDNVHQTTSTLAQSLKTFMNKKGLLAEFIKYEEFLDGTQLRLLLLNALMHDASEAYMVDLPTPIKRIKGLEEYARLEKQMMYAIEQALGLPAPTELERTIIVWADLLALRIEAAMLMPSRGHGWNVDFPDMEPEHTLLFPDPLHWALVDDQFIERYEELS